MLAPYRFAAKNPGPLLCQDVLSLMKVKGHTIMELKTNIKAGLKQSS